MSDFVFRVNKKRVGIQLAVITAIYAIFYLVVYGVGDQSLTIDINQLMVASPPWLQSIAYYYTKFGYYVFGITAIVIAILAFYVPKFERLKPYRIMFLGLAFGFSVSWFVMAYVLKPTIMRLRPYVEYPSQITLYQYQPGEFYASGGYSFPSGHATAAFGMSGAMMARVQKWVFRILLYAYAILLSFTRPYFGVHYVTDIIAGSILGLVCSVGFYMLFEYLNAKGRLTEKVQKVLFLIGLGIVIISIVLDLFG